MRSILHLPSWTIAVILAVSLAACEDSPDDFNPIVLDEEGTPTALRIVSLAPALTQMVVDLGLGEHVVGVVRQDAAAPSSAVVLGAYDQIDFERLVQLEPTHVLAMTGQQGVPDRLEQLAKTRDFTLASFRNPQRISDIYEVLVAITAYPESGAQSVAHALNVVSEGQELVALVQQQLTAIRSVVEAHLDYEAAHKKALVVIGTNPIMAVGPETVHDDLFFRISAMNAAQFERVPNPVYDREGLLQLEPDVIVLLLPNAPPLGPDDVRLRPFQGLDIPAVRNDRIVLIDHPLGQLPSTSIPLIAAEMAKAVHPQIAAEIDAVLSDPPPLPQDVEVGDAPPPPPSLDE